MINTSLLLDSLRELASIDLQKKLWLPGDSEEMSTFEEAICQVFDDAHLTRALENGYIKNNFSKQLFEKAIELNRSIDAVDYENLYPEEIIENPKMETVRKLAGELICLFEKEIG